MKKIAQVFENFCVITRSQEIYSIGRYLRKILKDFRKTIASSQD